MINDMNQFFYFCSESNKKLTRMDRIKSIFITAATMFWMGVVVWSFIQGITKQDWHEGLILSALLPILFLATLFIFNIARTSKNLKIILLLIVSGVSWEWLVMNIEKGSLLVLILAVVNLTLWLLYIHWYSVFPNRKNNDLAIGEKLPVLTFKAQDGNTVKSDEFKGKKLIYLFYRGNWCPLCMAQIKEISAQYKKLNELGAEVLLISPQPHHFTVSLAQKMDVPFWFLQDEDSKVAKQLDLYIKAGTPLGMEMFGFDSDSVMPTVIICDEEGKIIFADQTDNYRVRPEPETFLKVLKGEVIA